MNNSDKIILFGASKRGIRHMGIIGREKVLCFCDNDKQKIGTVLEDKKVIGVEELKEVMFPDIKIVISSTFEKEIYEQLKQLGFKDKVDLNYWFHLYKSKNFILFKDSVSGRGYFFGIYDDDGSCFDLVKKEYLYGEEWKADKKFVFSVEENCLLPVGSIGENHVSLDIQCNNQNYKKDLVINRFEYFPFKNNSKLEIKANKDIIIGSPIPLYQKKQHRVKLNLLILVDSLTQNMIEEYGLKELMPYTYEFFRDAMKFQNCYCCADWTLPGVGTIFTGQYPIEHRMLKNLEERSLNDRLLITKYFKEEDFLTSFFNSNWRATPEYGYIKDMDRSIYVDGMTKGIAYELICNFLEHLRAFPNRDHFSVLSLYDLHHLQRKIQNIACQTHTTLETHFYEDSFKGKSVFKNYDSIKKNIYAEEIRHLDFYLQILYNYLTENFSNNLAVIFAADHGVSYISQEDYNDPNDIAPNFKESMFHVPLMIKAPDIKEETVFEFVDNRSISEIFQYFLNEKEIYGNEEMKNICKQDYVYNESIYQGQTYKVKIIDKDYEFFLKSEKEVDEECRINLGNFEVRLLDKRTGNKVNKLGNEAIFDRYIGIVKKHLEL